MAVFKRILIATDGSENAKAAARQGLELARLAGAEVEAICVVDVGAMAYAARGPSMVDVYTYLEEAAREALEEVRKEGERVGIPVRITVKRGVPGTVIVDSSKDFDLVVIGSIGHGGLVEFLMGSVAEKVVRFAHCPVLVVHGRAPQ